jgi:hypothetical protein
LGLCALLWPASGRADDLAELQHYALLPSDAPRRVQTQAEDHRRHDLIREAINKRLAAQDGARSAMRSGRASTPISGHVSLAGEFLRTRHPTD